MKAHDFTLKDQDGKSHSLKDYRGKWVVLFFYPKDDSPGCKIEACAFRDEYKVIRQEDAVVLGVSKDGAESHKDFADKYGLQFPLLVDPDGEVTKAYKAWGKKMFGHEGILRKTFIIAPDGEVLKVYGRVTPMGHGAQVVTDLRILKKSLENQPQAS